LDEEVQLRCRGELLRVCCEAVVKRPQRRPARRTVLVLGPGRVVVVEPDVEVLLDLGQGRVARLLGIAKNGLVDGTPVMIRFSTSTGVPRRVQGK